MNLDDALKTFIIESYELLDQMEETLLDMEQSGADVESIHALFRAAHTIKGSAGLFGLNDIVQFTHVAESVLDRVRNAEIPLTPELAALLLEAGDHIRAMVDFTAEGEAIPAATLSTGQAIVVRLNGYLQAQSKDLSVSEPPVQKSGHTLHKLNDGPRLDTEHWHISLRFGPDVYRNGLDPAAFIRYLGTLGTVQGIFPILDKIPEASTMDPETCYLGFEIAYRSEADKEAIEGVFEFVREDCALRILPPHSKIAEYLALIHDLPEEDMRLGEILIECGTLTANELEQVLTRQGEIEAVPKKPIGEVLVEEQIVQPAVVDAALEKQRQVKDSKSGDTGMVRVDAGKLDQLINLVGELIIAGAGANLIAQRSGVDTLYEATTTMSRLVEEIRNSALNLRMVQIGATFSRFQRVVRDVSHELGKDIRLDITGGETELDKTVVEKIGDPLTHLVRNSMDHGIEPAEIRVARGKPAHGTLRLNAHHDSGGIVIEVSDDGGGLNRDKILAKAIDRGLVKPDNNLTDKEIFNLIFEPGFSTADKVNNLSGRGVGMDVVRKNITALRGTIELDSSPGQGMIVSIRLPLTLAIIDGFLIEVGEYSYVIPLEMVVECVELSERDRMALDERSYLNLRGEVLPLINLREHFSVRHAISRRSNIVVVQHADHKAGLVVDALLGEFQTVIKPLGKIFSGFRGVSGSTILGSGEVALILDVAELIQREIGKEQRRRLTSEVQ
ncbi:chemotaxis protein CheA [Halothiobacillus diazotrophicus]|uniref:Chemotaxis protein CheA n=1 Tax=Halothiobacillus diazotrophicus TaxID=1860122 RepID=A0A191ZEN2_9GAMM|nr:chemotaxis protein CheA [Halothiobacillus diazotrophicus]ANJ66336.1 chemotaxis protein CheA [Halothiobacillus diazotrophicus]